VLASSQSAGAASAIYNKITKTRISTSAANNWDAGGFPLSMNAELNGNAPDPTGAANPTL
jgi:hypothetical protein